MKAALVVKPDRYDGNVEANLSDIAALTREAADSGANLVLFPEYSATMGENTGDRLHDFQISQPVPGPVTAQLAALTRALAAYLAIGILERDGNCLYDTAVLFDPGGELALKHRRNNAKWHGRNADPAVYCQGHDIPVTQTRFGSIAFAICGDLFDEQVVPRIAALAPRYLLWPAARSFNDGSFDQERWDRDEEPEYIRRARLTGCTTLMVNKLGDRSKEEYPAVGGALALSSRGEVIDKWPLGRKGILYVDV